MKFCKLFANIWITFAKDLHRQLIYLAKNLEQMNYKLANDWGILVLILILSLIINKMKYQRRMKYLPEKKGPKSGLALKRDHIQRPAGINFTRTFYSVGIRTESEQF